VGLAHPRGAGTARPISRPNDALTTAARVRGANSERSHTQSAIASASGRKLELSERRNVSSDLLPAEHSHVVHFYASAEVHVRLVAAQLAGALAESATVIVAARPTRCDALRAAVAAHDVDVAAARVDGRYVELDAHATLSRFMGDASPDAHRFDAVVGELVAAAASAGPVQVYGEMVGLLWEAGHVAAAIEVEQLWESLVSRVPFRLVCGYECPAVFSDAEMHAFDEICRRHSAVLGGAPTSDTAERSRRFARSPSAPHAAREFLTETLQRWGLDALIVDAALVVSELASNAVVHAGSDFAVGLSRHRDGVRIDVSDASPVRPCVQAGGAAVVGGLGLPVVAALTAEWGHHSIEGGKLVWAELVPGACPVVVS
jgi:anti-sigma regulatory factor (Ser/Thr protein kinase)